MEPRRPQPRRDPRLIALAEESGYEIAERIGSGGMGIVYRGQDADGHEVAIKLLRHEIADDPRARDRLAREVAAQKLVRNDNIARILDAELDSSEAFVVTEFVPGPTLEDAVLRHGGLHPEVVREIAVTLGESLRAIHAAGVIHRDLKPSNVLLRGAREEDLSGFDPEGDRIDPVIIDFGIAVAAEESRLTSTGLVMGTAAYLDPEVLRTNHTAEAGDWWAWAAMTAFAATGREPYGSGRADLVFLRAERGEIDLEGVPVELGDWLREALQSDPAARPDPVDLLARLGELDLERYEDAGATQVLGAGPAPGAGESGQAGEDRTEALPLVGDRAEALPRVDERPTEQRTESLAQWEDDSTDRTEALPRVEDPPADRTQALPLEQDRPADRTQALPLVQDQQADRTEVLPPVGPPTRLMPVIREEIRPTRPAPTPYPAPAAYPVRRAPEPVAPGAALPPSAGLAPYAQQYAPAPGAGAMPWPPQAPPPPRRGLLVWTGHVLLIALAGVAPYVALAALLLLGAAARTWERSHRAVQAKRFRGVNGSGPVVAAVLAAPFRFLGGLVETALQALLPLVLGLLVGIAVDAALWFLGGTAAPDGIAFATAMAITLLVTWVGLGSRTTRDGAHRMVDAAAPDRTWTVVLGGLLLLLLAAVVFTLLARQGMVDYLPFAQGPTLADIAVWRL